MGKSCLPIPFVYNGMDIKIKNFRSTNYWIFLFCHIDILKESKYNFSRVKA